MSDGQLNLMANDCSCFGWLPYFIEAKSITPIIIITYLMYVLQCLTEVLFPSRHSLVYGGLPGLHASNSPQATVPPAFLVTSYPPDIALYNQNSNLAVLLARIIYLLKLYSAHNYVINMAECKHIKGTCICQPANILN